VDLVHAQGDRNEVHDPHVGNGDIVR
jgi:hypothetical protein